MRFTDDSLDSIAHRVGYADSYAFSTAFKRLFAETPLANADILEMLKKELGGQRMASAMARTFSGFMSSVRLLEEEMM